MLADTADTNEGVQIYLARLIMSEQIKNITNKTVKHRRPPFFAARQCSEYCALWHIVIDWGGACHTGYQECLGL